MNSVFFLDLGTGKLCRQWGEREARREKGREKEEYSHQQNRLLSLKNQCQGQKRNYLNSQLQILFRKLFHLHTVAREAMRTGISRRHSNKSYDVDNMDF